MGTRTSASRISELLKGLLFSTRWLATLFTLQVDWTIAVA
jgi:hypothetical protein